MGNLVLDSTGTNPAHKGARAFLGQPDVAEVITAQLFLWPCRTMKGWFAGNTKAEKTLALRLHNAQREFTTVMKSGQLSRSLEECWLLFYSDSACNRTGKGDRAPDRNLGAPEKWQMQEKQIQFFSYSRIF